MNHADDTTLLRAYALRGDEHAFAELVRRHVNLVYFAALRQTNGDSGSAQDVAQRVFADLARKAGQLGEREVLTGWLYTSTRYAALKARRAELRRHAREQQALAMDAMNSEPAREWERLRPVLDEALDALEPPERDAVLLRFFENRSYPEVGAALSIADDAARKRVERAMAKLRDWLQRRGIESTATALTAAFENQAMAEVAPGIVAQITSGALAGTGSTGAVGAFFAMTKLEIGIAVAVFGAGLFTGGRELLANQSLRAALAAGPDINASLVQARNESRQRATSVAPPSSERPEARELATLQAKLAQLNARPGWVREAAMKQPETAHVRGWSTAQDALESFVAASVAGDRAALAAHFAFVGDARAEAAAAFATLPEALRVKFGSADRLAAEAYFQDRAPGLNDFKWSARGATLDSATPGDDAVAGYWADIDPAAKFARPGTMLRVWGWAKLASGAERPLTIDLAYAGGGQWALGTSRFSAAEWTKLVARVAPATSPVAPPRQ